MIRRYMLWFVLAIFALGLLATCDRSLPSAGAAPVPAPPSEAAYAEWTYSIPVEPDTQSGAPFFDAQGRVFSVVRDESRLKVYRDDALVLDKREGYGAVFGQVRNDGCLYVSALREQRPRVEWKVYRVPTFVCVRFITPVAHLPSASVP